MKGGFLRRVLLGALHVDGVRAFRGHFDLERNLIAFVQFVERHTDQRFAVEEQVLLLALGGNEAETAVRLGFDSTSHSSFIKYTF